MLEGFSPCLLEKGFSRGCSLGQYRAMPQCPCISAQRHGRSSKKCIAFGKYQRPLQQCEKNNMFLSVRHERQRPRMRTNLECLGWRC